MREGGKLKLIGALAAVFLCVVSVSLFLTSPKEEETALPVSKIAVLPKESDAYMELENIKCVHIGDSDYFCWVDHFADTTGDGICGNYQDVLYGIYVLEGEPQDLILNTIPDKLYTSMPGTTKETKMKRIETGYVYLYPAYYYVSTMKAKVNVRTERCYQFTYVFPVSGDRHLYITASASKASLYETAQTVIDNIACSLRSIEDADEAVVRAFFEANGKLDLYEEWAKKETAGEESEGSVSSTEDPAEEGASEAESTDPNSSSGTQPEEEWELEHPQMGNGKNPTPHTEMSKGPGDNGGLYTPDIYGYETHYNISHPSDVVSGMFVVTYDPDYIEVYRMDIIGPDGFYKLYQEEQSKPGFLCFRLINVPAGGYGIHIGASKNVFDCWTFNIYDDCSFSELFEE